MVTWMLFTFRLNENEIQPFHIKMKNIHRTLIIQMGFAILNTENRFMCNRRKTPVIVWKAKVCIGSRQWRWLIIGSHFKTHKLPLKKLSYLSPRSKWTLCHSNKLSTLIFADKQKSFYQFNLQAILNRHRPVVQLDWELKTSFKITVKHHWCFPNKYSMRTLVLLREVKS